VKRVKSILCDEEYQTRIHEIEAKEVTRRFCRHGLEHLMAVARIAYIINLEESCGLSRELIYAAALLHDIGRCTPEEDSGVGHRAAGVAYATRILRRCDFSEDEISAVIAAVEHHGAAAEAAEAGDLAGLIYRADKLSRDCAGCGAYDECNWDVKLKGRLRDRDIIY